MCSYQCSDRHDRVTHRRNLAGHLSRSNRDPPLNRGDSDRLRLGRRDAVNVTDLPHLETLVECPDAHPDRVWKLCAFASASESAMTTSSHSTYPQNRSDCPGRRTVHQSCVSSAAAPPSTTVYPMGVGATCMRAWGHIVAIWCTTSVMSIGVVTRVSCLCRSE